MSRTSRRWAEFRLAVVGQLTPDLRNVDYAGFLHDRALVLYRPQKPHDLHMRAVQKTMRRTGATDPHKASSPPPDEAGGEKHFMDLHAAS